jgi:hypothetical protein
MLFKDGVICICYFPNERKVLANIKVIKTVLVKIWSNSQITEPEAVATQPRPAQQVSPSIYVFPKYILLKDGVICMCYFPNERKVLAIT